MAKKKGDRIDDIKISLEKVWLAGLGALSQAEKQGDKLFKTLVKQGKKYEELIPVAGDAVKDSVKTARKQAGSAFQGMEAAFDRQVNAAMKRAGLASKKELDALKKEVAHLKKKTNTRGSGATKKKTVAKKKATTTKKKKKPSSKKRTRR